MILKGEKFEPKRFESFINRTEKDLNEQIAHLNAKREALARTSHDPFSSSFGISENETMFLKEAQLALHKQLDEKRTNLIKRISSVKTKKKSLTTSPIKNFTEESQEIKKLTLEQEAADLEAKLNEMSHTQSLIEKQQDVQQQTGASEKTSQTLSQKWLQGKAELEKKLAEVRNKIGQQSREIKT